jgi:hypothetical protein
VNALVIEPVRGDAESGARLTRYFEQYVIGGPGAFTETIFGFADYGAAMRRKLLRELAPAVGWERTPINSRDRAEAAPGTQASPSARHRD